MPKRKNEPVPTRRGGRRSQRDQILEAAVALIAKGGTRATTLAAIAKSTGVTAPAITHHFGTKEALLREVIATTDHLNTEPVQIEPDADGMATLRATLSWGRAIVANPGLADVFRLSAVMMVEALDVDHPAHTHFVRRHRRFRRQLRAIIELGQDDGSIRGDVDAGRLAAEINSFMLGAELQWFLDPKDVDLVALHDQYLERLCATLAPSPRRVAAVGGDGSRRGRPSAARRRPPAR